MKQKRKANQIELFCERKFISDQILCELPPDRRVELENGIVELLLNLALDQKHPSAPATAQPVAWRGSRIFGPTFDGRRRADTN